MSLNGTRYYDVASIGTGQGGKPLAASGASLAMDPAIWMLSQAVS